ncbi:hypothetical protein JCM3775_005173 [Rhodotorula graminis]|uniref:Zeta toxin domain-containing protein n=1 Tax=Rhodotorula graminis (strain WP1) TaxID=578459 RepID=A0A0P9GXT2_RHOGW|nr:uncharacterized protein RHOBADRAFT_56059 [Rhodotorula graminis WP1]KPV72246.1 hypothetical protein RHOBADRAFT_56059 [Rhodotorula graminis WP1]
MAPAKHRYAGPQPACPPSLDHPPPTLSQDQLAVPTTELYSAALEHAWRQLDPSSSSSSQRPTPARVDQLEPRPDDPSRPRPVHHGPYALVRAQLDWTYHVVPNRARQHLQDEIVTRVLEQRLRECDEAGDDEPCRVSERREAFAQQEQDPDGVRGVRSDDMGRKAGDREEDRPLALFTAGGMGAGKGHTLKELLKSHAVRLPRNTVWIDPDALSRMLPERPQYVAHDPENASALLHPEASLLQEVCASVAREQRRSLVVDGSLTDCGWFEGFMRKYREAGYDCEILFVSAPEDVMLRRAEKRAKSTGRVTRPEAIKRSRIKSPECVTKLSKPGLVRRVRLIDNSSDTSPASTMYDSALDPLWPGSTPTPYHDPTASPSLSAAGRERGKDVNEGGWVDAKGFVEGRLEQGEDGRVRERRGADARGGAGAGAGAGGEGRAKGEGKL